VNEKTPARQLADVVGDDKARTIITAGWDALRPLVGAEQLHGGVADYAATVVALAVLDVLNISKNHRIEFRADGWTIQHPLACRDDMFGCPLNRAAEDLNGPPSDLGIYECQVGQDGCFEVLGRVVPEATT